MNQKNSLGLNHCFLDLEDPIKLFGAWMDDAKKSEPNDPNALSLATSTKDNFPSVRIVLLKEFNHNGFVFYTNLNSQKGNELKENPKAAMCFHWKSLLRQIRVSGTVTQVEDVVADQYYNSRGYESRIGAWASKQSKELNNRDELMNSIKEFKQKYNDENKVPRPSHWSGWNLSPLSFEFWLDGDSRIHERLKYTIDKNGNWIKSLLNP
ncbi:pyridoxamine 5'-phosphate oxidase [Candidatus Pelagibacter bacterium nBUS_32]|jgi:pyridoxamine 5'-phosphate oxidase|uniref:pyridoxamine 5'-phosphate oxidase n=1 Tax=Candidatus Pelagibacter bacterium nBUS_32 TaxID=3374192 RepID=UPI003EBE2D9E